jgi:ribosomal protein S11
MPKPYTLRRRAIILKQGDVVKRKTRLMVRILRKKQKLLFKRRKRRWAPYKNRYLDKKLSIRSTSIVYLTFTRTYSNMFLTAINRRGGVIITHSTGTCNLHTKKKKRSWDALKSIASRVGDHLRSKNIKLLRKLYMKYKYMKNYKIILGALKRSGVYVTEVVYYNTKAHSLLMRKKKVRRI